MKVRRKEGEPFRGVFVWMRVVADERQPVDGGPETRVAADEFVGNPRVDLAPGRCLVHEDGQDVGGLCEVETGKRAHRRRTCAVPPGVWRAVDRPVVGRRRLVPDIAQPTAGSF